MLKILISHLINEFLSLHHLSHNGVQEAQKQNARIPKAQTRFLKTRTQFQLFNTKRTCFFKQNNPIWVRNIFWQSSKTNYTWITSTTFLDACDAFKDGSLFHISHRSNTMDFNRSKFTLHLKRYHPGTKIQYGTKKNLLKSVTCSIF